MDQTSNGKKRVAVLFGGCSSEYGVSLQSASAVIRNIDTEKYEVLTVGIKSSGEWLYYDGPVEAIEEDRWHIEGPVFPAVFRPAFKGIEIRKEADIQIEVDVVLPVLHGKNGEDGTVQGLIELTGIPLAGCDTFASALCMDKKAAHKMVHAAGIAVPESVLVKKGIEDDELETVTEKLSYPLFVKPLRAGSSFGISKIYQPEELSSAVGQAFLHDTDVVIEENIDGFEVGCAVLGNQELIVGRADEIELSGGFFDFTEKYTLKSSHIHMPARVSEAIETEIRETAKVIYHALGCRGFARVDMFLTPDHKLVFNEVNTIPGFTSHSRYPNMMKGIGIEFGELIDRILELASEEM